MSLAAADRGTGPNGPLPQEVIAMHPNAPFIKRNGEVDAWDNEDFRNAVIAANRSQVILSGITTDVSCISYPYWDHSLRCNTGLRYIPLSVSSRGWLFGVAQRRC